MKAVMGCTLQFDVLNATFSTDATLLITATFGIDDEDIGLNLIKRGNKVDNTPTLVDVGLFHSLDVLHHEETFFLGEHRLAMFIF